MSTPITSAATRIKREDAALESPTQRAVAVTFDDLPAASVTRQDIAHYREITNKLLSIITANKIPAIGFVNEAKLYREGKWYWKSRLDDARVTLLKQWIDSGLELGNHSFSHPDLNTTPLDSYKADVIRGEAVTSKLLRRKAMRLRYFRYPFLRTGTNLETRRRFEEFLALRGYRAAPGTVASADWIFAAAYAKAAERDDKEMLRRVATAYVPFVEAEFAYAEKQSAALLGYEIKQVLVLHANALNADHLGVVVDMMKRRGYSFISLDEALTDEAYALPDTYTGPKGISWLHRWAWTASKPDAFFEGEPVPPAFVMEEAGVTLG
jgi:peptidoglycan/xylan/chitin deacetylase (PgdA/CDA1 family)